MQPRCQVLVGKIDLGVGTRTVAKVPDATFAYV